MNGSAPLRVPPIKCMEILPRFCTNILLNSTTTLNTKNYESPTPRTYAHLKILVYMLMVNFDGNLQNKNPVELLANHLTANRQESKQKQFSSTIMSVKQISLCPVGTIFVVTSNCCHVPWHLLSQTQTALWEYLLKITALRELTSACSFAV